MLQVVHAPHSHSVVSDAPSDGSTVLLGARVHAGGGTAGARAGATPMSVNAALPRTVRSLVK